MNTNQSGVDPVPPASEHSRYPQPMPVRHRWTQDWNGKVCIGCGARWDSTLDGAACRGMLYTDSERAFVEAAAKVHDDAAASEKRGPGNFDQAFKDLKTNMGIIDPRPKRSPFVEFPLTNGGTTMLRADLIARIDGNQDTCDIWLAPDGPVATVKATIDEVRNAIEAAL